MSNPHETNGLSRIGWWVFIGLAIVTLIEYGVAIALSLNLFFLTQIAVLKAGLIIVYFMRIGRAFQRTEEEED
jgi:hypothetical protein